MANALLDFVMSLVRDPEAAARYSADPERAIAEAQLSGVTSVDVSNLIPVVSESMPTAPGAGTVGGLEDAGLQSNVWASGAAIAAFDAFADEVPTPALDDSEVVVRKPIEDAGSVTASELDAIDSLIDSAPTMDSTVSDASAQFIDVDKVGEPAPPFDDFDRGDAASHPVDDPGPGFDIFE